MNCKKCGSELKSSYKFCNMCGTRNELFEISVEKMNLENESKNSESKFEKFMEKHFYKNVQAMTITELEKCSIAMSILMVLFQLIRIICACFNFNTSFMFVGEIICVLSDWFFLSKMGIRGAWKLFGLFLYPVYLFIKANKTNKKYVWSIICTVILIGGLGLLVVYMTRNNEVGVLEKNDKQMFEEVISDSNTMACERVQNGALIDTDLDAFSTKFSRVMQETYLELTGEKIYIDLSQYWSNIVPPQTSYEDETGTPFTLYSAFFDNTYLITATVVDDKIRDIKVCFDYDDNTIPKVLYGIAIQAVGDMDIYEVNEMCEILEEGIIDNTMIYKDGILYYIETQTVSYGILPASKEFVQRLEDGGNCNIIYR